MRVTVVAEAAGGPEVSEEALSGQCLCGDVKFTVEGPLRQVLVCHCGQCRRMSGHLWAATAAQRDAVTFQSKNTLRWFASSQSAERGFCNRCGSSLFWSHEGRDTLSIAAGSLDTPTGLKTEAHIYVSDASDYYRIHPDEPTQSDLSD